MTQTQFMLDDISKLNVDKKRIAMPENIGSFQEAMNALKEKRLTPRTELRLVNFQIARHCNLNCAGCSVFAPLVDKPTFPDINDFNRDLSRLSYLLGDKIKSVNLIGGEPLLNPQICEFIRCTRKHFERSTIMILSNGILLSNMKEDFWVACKECDVSLTITPYPFLNIEKLRNIAFHHCVELELFPVPNEKTTINFAYDLSGKQDPLESFSNCIWANECITIEAGKLATCQPIVNMEFFNSFFGANIEVTPDDYIDIHKAKSGQEILEFLSKPVPMCRYCDVNKRTLDNPWHLSKKDIKEWTV